MPGLPGGSSKNDVRDLAEIDLLGRAILHLDNQRAITAECPGSCLRSARGSRIGGYIPADPYLKSALRSAFGASYSEHDRLAPGQLRGAGLLLGRTVGRDYLHQRTQRGDAVRGEQLQVSLRETRRAGLDK